MGHTHLPDHPHWSLSATIPPQPHRSACLGALPPPDESRARGALGGTTRGKVPERCGKGGEGPEESWKGEEIEEGTPSGMTAVSHCFPPYAPVRNNTSAPSRLQYPALATSHPSSSILLTSHFTGPPLLGSGTSPSTPLPWLQHLRSKAMA